MAMPFNICTKRSQNLVEDDLDCTIAARCVMRTQAYAKQMEQQRQDAERQYIQLPEKET